MSALRIFGSFPKGLDRLLQEELSGIDVESKKQLDLYFDFVTTRSTEESFRVLMLLEPPSVMPENYATKTIKSYDLVIPLSQWRAEMMGLPFFAFQPVDVPNRVLDRGVKESKIVFVNALKFGAVSSSLYGWRLEILRKLQRRGHPVDIFGPNWDMSIRMEIRKRFAATRRALSSKDFLLSEAWKEFSYRPVGVKGEAQDKLETISKYKFALIIENDKFSLTEKLFDALFSGAIVFYRGPKLNLYTTLGNYCHELPEDVDLAVQMIEAITELPDSQKLTVDSRELEDNDFARSFSLKNTSTSLAAAIISSIRSRPIG